MNVPRSIPPFWAKPLVRLLVACLGLWARPGTTAEQTPAPSLRWVVYYADAARHEDFAPYDLVVLDSLHHPGLLALRDQGKVLLGYASLGEAEQHRSWFAAVRAEGLLVRENPHWPGSWTVDVRDARWVKRVVEDIVPAVLRQGFHGLFVDTLDNPIALEREDPQRYAGMQDATVRLVQTLRYHFPDMKIMINRGYEVLPRLAEHIDYVLGESVRADYDFENKTYRRVGEEDYRWQVDQLLALQRQRPALGIFTLDYWDPEDAPGVARLYREQRANGFSPYVATIDLDRIVPEPAP
ncbi:MAG: endo alpha-1,4 polygalactosaminidase [Magnetococcus sp. WYHC-3]